MRLVASLAVVVGLMLLLARVVGRRYGARAGAPVQVLHRQALSRGASVTVISVGSRVLLVGATDQQVSLLTELDPDELGDLESPGDPDVPATAAAEEQHGALDEETGEKVKAYAAATDNVGLFFGEDIFIAIGSIILIQSTLAAMGYDLTPLDLAKWAIPTAIAAFLIHGARLLLLDRSLRKPKP